MSKRSAKRRAKRKKRAGRRRYQVLPEAVRRRIIAAAERGASYRQIVEQLDVPMGSVGRVLAPLGGVFAGAVWSPGSNALTLEERITIQTDVKAGKKRALIARELGRSRSTVTREVANRSVDGVYSAQKAHQQAYEAAGRPKGTKLDRNPQLLEEVETRLGLLHSPEQIAQRLAMDFPEDPTMRISHETIYKSLYLQARGELKREVLACLRTGRTVRKNRNRGGHPGPIPNPVPISQRPAEVADRAVPGHHEGDLIIGANGNSAIGTVVERTTRRSVLVHLPGRHDATSVCTALVDAFATMPAALARSLTWDRGSEMANHATFTANTGIDVYFCDPHSPWQRPSNENFNGLLRQIFPKGTDLSGVTADELHHAQELLNNRPRKTLGWRTPNEAYADLVAQQS